MKKKFAIVTGGTRGIGRAISLDLARQGVKVLALYARNSKAAQELLAMAHAEQLDVECLKGDLTKEEKFQEIIAEIKKRTDTVDIVVHSAASGVHREALEITSRHLEWTFHTNVFSIHQLLCELVPMMTAGGRIVGITSNGGTRVLPFYTVVGSSKGAMESLFRHYAREWAPKGIAVNLVCPGMVLTEATEAFPDKEDRIKQCVDRTPTGKMTTPEDVSQVVNFLCLNPHAAQIIGQTWAIDGGKSLLA